MFLKSQKQRYEYNKIKFIAKIHVSVYSTSLQLQIDDYINSTSIKQFFPPNFNNDNKTIQLNRFKENY